MKGINFKHNNKKGIKMATKQKNTKIFDGNVITDLGTSLLNVSVLAQDLKDVSNVAYYSNRHDSIDLHLESVDKKIEKLKAVIGHYEQARNQ